MPLPFFKKVKKEHILYKKFKDDKLTKSIEIQKIEQEAKIKPVKEKIIKDKPVKPKKIKKDPKKLYDYDMTITIAVAALDDKCGCSFIAQAIANYIKNFVRKTVCIVDMQGKYVNKDSNILFCKYVDICSMYDRYKFIIIDVGNLNSRTENELIEFKRANIKLMIARNDEEYHKEIAKYIHKDKEAVKKWAFIFNLVIESLAYQIDVLMAHYEHYCLPSIDKEILDVKTQSVFYEILKKKR